MTKIHQQVPYLNFDEINDIKRFLTENGFTHTSAIALDCLAKLVYKSACEQMINISNEYALLSRNGTNGNNCRTKLNYYIKSNFEAVRSKLIANFNCDIGEFFGGVKTFVERIAIIYSLYARK